MDVAASQMVGSCAAGSGGAAGVVDVVAVGSRVGVTTALFSLRLAPALAWFAAGSNDLAVADMRDERGAGVGRSLYVRP